MEKGIYKFEITSQLGELTGIFIATEKELKKLIGKKFYFYEKLGKHSEVWGSYKGTEWELVTQEPEMIKGFEKYNLTFGINPFDYLSEQI